MFGINTDQSGRGAMSSRDTLYVWSDFIHMVRREIHYVPRNFSKKPSGTVLIMTITNE